MQYRKNYILRDYYYYFVKMSANILHCIFSKKYIFCIFKLEILKVESPISNNFSTLEIYTFLHKNELSTTLSLKHLIEKCKKKFIKDFIEILRRSNNIGLHNKQFIL